MDEHLKQRIQQLIGQRRVFLFMKGTPEEPQCGFSLRVVNILRSLNTDFGSFDVLEDEEIRRGIKEYADWPTIPQVYIDGKFVGGCDITEQLYNRGELQVLIKKENVSS